MKLYQKVALYVAATAALFSMRCNSASKPLSQPQSLEAIAWQAPQKQQSRMDLLREKARALTDEYNRKNPPGTYNVDAMIKYVEDLKDVVEEIKEELQKQEVKN